MRSARDRLAMLRAVHHGDPPLYTPAWVRERALRGLVALEDEDPEVVREVLDSLGSFDPFAGAWPSA